MDLGTLSLALSSFFTLVLWWWSRTSLTLGEGISFISHSVAASFLADTGACLVLAPPPTCDGGYLGDSRTDAGDLELSRFHVGTGVVDPPRFPTRMALLNL